MVDLWLSFLLPAALFVNYMVLWRAWWRLGGELNEAREETVKTQRELEAQKCKLAEELTGRISMCVHCHMGGGHK